MKKSIKKLILLIFILQFIVITSILFDVETVFVILLLLFLDGIGLAIMIVHFLRHSINKKQHWLHLHGKGSQC